MPVWICANAMYGVSAVGAAQDTGERLTTAEAMQHVIAVTDDTPTRLYCRCAEGR
jgi:hypothetical protein